MQLTNLDCLRSSIVRLSTRHRSLLGMSQHAPWDLLGLMQITSCYLVALYYVHTRLAYHH